MQLNIVKQAGIEGTEELIAEVTGNIADSFVMGDKLNYNNLVKQYEESGLSTESAKKKAFTELYLVNPVTSFVGGAMSGGVFGGMAVGINAMSNRNEETPNTENKPNLPISSKTNATPSTEGQITAPKNLPIKSPILTEGAFKEKNGNFDSLPMSVEEKKANEIFNTIVQKSENNIPSVSTKNLEENNIVGDMSKARIFFVRFAHRVFPSSVVNTNTGETIDIPRNGIDKFLSGNISNEKYASGFVIPEIIENCKSFGGR